MAGTVTVLALVDINTRRRSPTISLLTITVIIGYSFNAISILAADRRVLLAFFDVLVTPFTGVAGSPAITDQALVAEGLAVPWKAGVDTINISSCGNIARIPVGCTVGLRQPITHAGTHCIAIMHVARTPIRTELMKARIGLRRCW
jgi:hypothetical protein